MATRPATNRFKTSNFGMYLHAKLKKDFDKKLIDDEISLSQFAHSVVTAYVNGDITVVNTSGLKRARTDSVAVSLRDVYIMKLLDKDGKLINDTPVTIFQEDEDDE